MSGCKNMVSTRAFLNKATSQVHWCSWCHQQPLDPVIFWSFLLSSSSCIHQSELYLELFSAESAGPIINRLEVILEMKRKFYWPWTKPHSLNLIYLEQSLKAYTLRGVRQMLKLSETSWGWDRSGGGMGERCRSSPRGFPGGSVVKNRPASAGDTGLIPELGRSTCCRATKPPGQNYWAYAP